MSKLRKLTKEYQKLATYSQFIEEFTKLWYIRFMFKRYKAGVMKKLNRQVKGNG